jgi:predicted HAD superfamily hydrolase
MFSLTNRALQVGRRSIGARITASRNAGLRVQGRPSAKQYARLCKASLVTLDVFDTSLLRTVGRPVDVFALTAWRFAQRHGRSVGGSAFTSARIAAEAESRKLARSAGRCEVTLSEIYAKLDPSVGGSCHRDLMLEELATERDVSFADPNVLALYNDLCDLGVPIAFVSDTYFSTQFVEQLLCEAGYTRQHRVFTSCEMGESKHDGGLFEAVARETGVQSKSISHIGDNVHSDVSMARRAGARAFWYVRSRERRFKYAEKGNHEAELAACVMQGVSASFGPAEVGANSAPWQKVGRDVAAPLYLAFTQWMIAGMRQVTPDVALFCARDGLIVKKVYDRLRPSYGTLPPSHYFLVSRRSLVFPAFEKIGPRELEFLCGSVCDIPVNEYFRRIGLDGDVERFLIEKHGLSLQSVVSSVEDKQRLKEIMSELTSRVLEIACTEREVLLRYLREMGCEMWQKIAICDVGWHGSLQEALRKVLLPEKPNLEMFGYYVGTSRKVHDVQSSSSILEGWLWNAGLPHDRMDVQENGREVMEFLFTARHPSIIGRTFDGTSTSPIYDEEAAADLRNREAADAVQEEALACIDRYMQAFGGLRPAQLCAEDAYRRLARLIERPTRAEVRFIGALVHVAGFGGSQTGQPLAAAPSFLEALRHPRECRKLYRECRWPTGFFAAFIGSWRPPFAYRAIRNRLRPLLNR